LAFRLWSDDPDRVDLLAFDAIAETLVDAVLDDSLDPVTLGVSGPWGSGKTTVLNLIDAHLAQRDDGSQP
jgi:pantothenate kinase-related protein Tda10